MNHNTKIHKLAARLYVVDAHITKLNELLSLAVSTKDSKNIRLYLDLINARFTELGY